MWPRTTISADRGGIAAGRDAIVGIPPEQLPAIIASAIDPLKKITDEQRAIIGELQNRLGANESQLQTFFRIIGEAGVAPEQVGERLVEIASRYKELLIQVDARPEDEPEVARLKAAAREALETGDLDQADALLAEVEQLQDSALDRLALEAAATRVQRGEIALTRLRYREAAAHFAAAAGRLPPGQEEQALAYLDQEADALYRQGEEFGDNAALVDAIARYRALLDRRPRERVPLDWAMTQNNLGNALLTLGERESGTARLEEAVAAYRAALEERTRERVPLDWAMTQNNLGIALSTLGERESGTARLEEAVAAYRAALEEWTRERVPLALGHDPEQPGQRALRRLGSGRAARRAWRRRSRPTARRSRSGPASASRSHWATTQNNLGIALWTLGERESGTARLEEAVAAYRAALKEWTRERVPLDWAMTQNNLGTALWTLGERESGTARLEEAVAAYRAALKEWTRERVPLDWATTQNNLGNALQTLGQRESGTARLDEAVAAYRDGPQGVDPRARPARLGDDPEQPGQRASDAWGAGERHGAPGRGGRGLPRGPQGADPRARPARLGHDPEQPGHRACDAWGANWRCSQAQGSARSDRRGVRSLHAGRSGAPPRLFRGAPSARSTARSPI